MRSILLLTLFVARTALAAPLDWATPVQPITSYKSDSGGYIDDAFALRDDGKAVAYLTTDGASHASLHLAEIGGKPEVVIAGAPLHTTAIHWLDAERVLLVDEQSATHKLVAQTFTARGPGKDKLGPFDGLALSILDGKPVVVTRTRSEKKKGPEHAFVAYARATLRPVARRSYSENGEGQVVEKAGPFKLLWFRDGYTTAATLQAGEYDQARDIRRPDRFARLELFKDKLYDAQEIEDVMGFAQALVDHKKRDGEQAFVHLTDDHKRLLLTDGLSQRELKLARELFMYQTDSFLERPLDPDHLLLSATVDPTNPPAVARKKADPDDIELYVVDVKNATAARVLRLPGEGRSSSWRAAGNRIALLRKSKGFERGGVELDVHELGTTATASTH